LSNNPDHAGLAQAAMDLDPPLRKLVCHQLAGAVLVVAQLGVSVDLAADRCDLCVEGNNLFNRFHG